MNNKKKIPIVAIMLMITIVNFTKLSGNEHIRPIQYFSLLAIGALIAILLQLIITTFKK